MTSHRSPLARLRCRAAELAWIGVAVGAPGIVSGQQTPALQPAATGSTIDYGLHVGAGHSDNIYRVPTGEESGSYRSAGFYFDVVRQQRRVDLDLTGDVERRMYDVEGVDSEPYGAINASALFRAVPDRFAWIMTDHYGQGRANSFLPTSPVNRQEINVFTTGPQVDLPVGQRSAVRLNATRSARSYENTGQLDSDVTDVDLGFYRAVRGTAEVGIGASSRDIDYDPPTVDRLIESAFLSYSRQLATGNASIRFGKTTAESGDAKDSAPLLSIAWDRAVGARSRIALSLDNGFTDTGATFTASNSGALGVPTPDNALLSADVFEFAALNVAYTLQHDRTLFSFGAGVGESSYQSELAFDNDQRNVDMAVERQIAPRLRIGVRGRFFDRQFESSDRRDLDRDAQLWLQKAFARRLSLRFTYLRASRGGNNAVQAYEESSFHVVLGVDLNT